MCICLLRTGIVSLGCIAMQDRARSYSFIVRVSVVCACGVTFYVWLNVPQASNPWPSVACFIIFSALAELLAVGVNESRGTLIAPNSPIHWASVCILGPIPAVVVCLGSAVAGPAISCLCHHVTRDPGDDVDAVASRSRGRVGRWMHGVVARIGSGWYARDMRLVARAIVLHTSTLIVSAGLSGLAYYALGGQFLLRVGADLDLLGEFALPFLGLVAVAILITHGEYVAVMSIIDPVPGAKGLYGFLLRARLALVEDVVPVWRGELFLVVVALLLSYLYAHIRLWGFILAVTPVLALRDFFHQWVETKAAYLNTITTLATYMQYYHPYTRGHLKRVADISERLARELRLPVESIMHMRTAGMLHDIGKIGVSEEILDKTEKLTDEEWERIKEHPVKGAEIVSHMEFLEGIVSWVKYHHKWHNGAGYPATNGNGADVPLEAAIIAVADAFDAMTDDRELTTDWECDTCGYSPADGRRPDRCPECGAEKRRVYRKPKSLDDAIDELRRGAGTQFHPSVVKAFLTMVERDGVHQNV